MKTGRFANLGLRMALDAGGMGTLEWDIPSGRITWSETLERMHRVEPGAFAGTREEFERHIHPEDRAQVREIIAHALETKSEFQVTYRIRPKEAVLACIEARGTVVCDSLGQPVRMVVVCVDVTERARAQDALQILADVSDTLTTSSELHQALDTAMECLVPRLADWCALHLTEGGRTVTTAVAHVDHGQEGTLRSALSATLSDRDHPYGPLVVFETGTPTLNPTPPEPVPRSPNDERNATAAIRPQSIIRVPVEIGRETAGVLTLATTQPGDGFDDFDLNLATQIARRIALAVGHARYYRDAKKAIRIRDEVLAIVSHDLRNPLNTIRMASAVLREEVGPEPRSRLDAIDRAVERANTLIRDLLDVACMQTRGLKIEPTPCDPASLLQLVATIFGPQAEDRSIRLAVIPPDFTDRILADRDRVAQVLSNLVANALQHTPEGGRVEVGARRSRDTTHDTVFWVRDSGPGIPPDRLPRLFEPFWQAREHRRSGAGLGLAIAKGLIDAHGGEIWVDDAQPGACFCFTLPLARGD